MNNNLKDNITVSICCITYNHEKYIAQAIEGFLMQRTDFPIEVLIHDDASTDRTSKIIRSYEENYPTLIKPIYQTVNQYSKGIKPTLKYNFPRAKGKYIAMCEGDDYWTDPHKLQKQVDFLESHQDCSICFHNVNAIYEDGLHEAREMCSPDQKRISTLEDLLLKDFIPTCSILFHRDKLYDVSDFFTSQLQGDWIIEIMLAQQGDIGYCSDVMAVYRTHNSGIWSGLSHISRLKEKIKFYKCINPYLDFKYNWLIRGILSRLYYRLAREYESMGEITNARRYAISSAMNLSPKERKHFINLGHSLGRLFVPRLYHAVMKFGSDIKRGLGKCRIQPME